MSSTLCLLTMLLLAPPEGESLSAEALASREYQLKAAFVYNFMQFTHWPPESFQSENSPIVLAVVGENPFGTDLERAVRDKQIEGRRIEVRYFSDAEAVSRCHVLFVPPSERDGVESVLGKLGDAPVLTIGETDNFTAEGGIIRFYLEEKKVRFEVNLGAAERVGLRLSSKLLRLARIYQENG